MIAFFYLTLFFSALILQTICILQHIIAAMSNMLEKQSEKLDEHVK